MLEIDIERLKIKFYRSINKKILLTLTLYFYPIHHSEVTFQRLM